MFPVNLHYRVGTTTSGSGNQTLNQCRQSERNNEMHKYVYDDVYYERDCLASIRLNVAQKTDDGSSHRPSPSVSSRTCKRTTNEHEYPGPFTHLQFWNDWMAPDDG